MVQLSAFSMSENANMLDSHRSTTASVVVTVISDTDIIIQIREHGTVINGGAVLSLEMALVAPQPTPYAIRFDLLQFNQVHWQVIDLAATGGISSRNLSASPALK